MLDDGAAPLAFGLTRGMARVIGVDIIRSVGAGRISRDEFEALVDRCTACPHHLRCAQYLGVTLKAPSLPAHCPNKPRIEALRGC